MDVRIGKIEALEPKLAEHEGKRVQLRPQFRPVEDSVVASAVRARNGKVGDRYRDLRIKGEGGRPADGHRPAR